MANLDGTLNGLFKVALAAVLAAGFALSVFVVVNQLALDRDAADRRAIIQRNTELTRGAVAPGSALSCLDAGAGDIVEAACEGRVFADAHSTASAVAYVGARLTLLAEASEIQPAALKALAASRRAVELDRYGMAAHVLATRDGCTPDKCAAFAWLGDAATVKANMKAQSFDQYVSRHADRWNGAAPAEPAPPAVSAAPQPAAPVQSAAVVPPGELVARPLADKYTLPSASSIPAVSIMNAEPALPRGAAEAQAAQSRTDAAGSDDVPIPRKRPQARAEPAAEPAAPLMTVR